MELETSNLNLYSGNEILIRGAELLTERLAFNETFWFGVFGLFFALAIFFCVHGIYSHVRRAIESKIFILLCIPVIAWTGILFLDMWRPFAAPMQEWLDVGLYACQILIPGFLMLHVWSQTSYKPVTGGAFEATFLVPAIVIAIEAARLVLPVGDAILFVQPFLAVAWAVVVLVRSYLFCFNVFYQMPPQMRDSTKRMLIAISVNVGGLLIVQVFELSGVAANFIMSAVYIAMLIALDSAFFIANSANVIVTSREFVHASLSTIVITVSTKGAILDWNRKDKRTCYPLPSPVFMEPYRKYRERVIANCNATVSPYDNNILTTNVDDKEAHFLFTQHEIGYRGRKLGYLIEVSEVTESYSVLRYLEDIALVDSLTGLGSRNAYLRAVRRVHEGAKLPLLILVGDVNNLKYTNDTRGHLVGDRLLTEVAKAIRTHAPAGAQIYRIGGDEIALLLPGGDAPDAQAFIARVSEALGLMKDKDFGTPSIAWGYAVMRKATENYNEVFKAADAIMYEVKKVAKSVSLSGIVPEETEEAPKAPAVPPVPDLPDTSDTPEKTV